ncbi:MAG: MFS transporter [Candidatus Hodarchaeota archaeon]
MNETDIKVKKFQDFKERTLPVFLILPLVIFLTGDLGGLVANQVLIIADLDMTFAQFGALVALSYIINGVFVLIFGYLSDKMTRKWMLVIGGVLWGLGNLLMAFSTEIWQLFLFRIIATIGAGVQAPVTFSLLSDMFPSKSRSNAFAWWGIANLVGSLLSGGVALAFNQIDFDALSGTLEQKVSELQSSYPIQITYWRYSFMLLSILGMCLAFLVLFVKEPKRASMDKEFADILKDDEIDYSHSYKIKKSDLKYIFVRKSNALLTLNFVDTVTSGVLTTNLISYFTLEMGFNFSLVYIGPKEIIFLLGAAVFLVMGLLGQFYFAKKGDKNLQNGDRVGRIKMMAYCAIFSLPFLGVAFAFTPNATNQTFFWGTLNVNVLVMGILFVIMMLLGGIGFGMISGGTPNWYASLIDMNYPEHRGTMIAVASLMDTIGRAVGAVVAGLFITSFKGTGYEIGTTLLITGLIFSPISAILSVITIKTGRKDFAEVDRVMAERAEALKQEKEGK